MIRHSLSVLIGILVAFVGCKKPPLPEPVIPADVRAKGLLVGNEGNFTWGNASVSFINFSTGEVSKDVFTQKNSKPLGDVCHSIYYANEKYYIAVNNSSKIEVVSANTFKSVATITGVSSPRYVLLASTDKLYVSDFQSNKIGVVDAKTHQVTSYISLKGWTEQMIVAEHLVWVTNMKSEYVYCIDPSLDKLVDSVKVGMASGNIALDRTGMLWVSCGDSYNNHPGKFVKIDPSSKKIVWETTYSDLYPTHLNPTKQRNLIYFLAKDQVYTINTLTYELKVIIPDEGKNLYSLLVHPDTEDIYISDAFDFVQKGKVYWYNSSGTRQAEYNVGIIPGPLILTDAIY